ncbi:MAG: SGNH/GDSL hydrolase family protein [Planctomycetota bacterium]
MEKWAFAFVVFGLIAVLTVAWLVVLRRWRRGGRRAALWGLGASCVALYAVVLLEIVFGHFVVKSDGYGITRAGYRWFQTYWRPINSLGYRDVEPVAPAEGQKVLLVVGDSLMAGHGIARLEDRFASLLARGLGSDWSVPVAAMCGWNTGDEIEALEQWPHRFDRLLVTYTLTDIETAALDLGRTRPDPAIEPPPALVRSIVAHSFFFNWVYWRYVRQDFGTRYPDFLEAMYQDPAVWAAHEARLGALVDLARSRGADVRFVLWPDMPRLDECAGPFAQVAQFLGARQVPVLDLTAQFRGRDPAALTVNELDEHPNEGVQAEIAAVVADWLQQGG